MRIRRGLTIVGVLALIAMAAPILSGPVDAADRSDSFSDVPDSHPFHDEIGWMAEGGYSTGFSDGTYRPALSVTRQAAVQMLWRMSGEPILPPSEPYTDVTPSHPFYQAINWAYSLGMVGVYPGGTFRSTLALARQSLAYWLHELSGVDGYGTATYVDVPANHKFSPAISWWTLSGQADGYSDGTFRPMSAVTRQSLAAFFNRFHEMMGGYWPFTDHDSHVCDTPPTAEDEAVAAELAQDAIDVVQDLYPTRGAALAAGYRITAPPFGSAGSHLVHDEFVRDGIQLDPTKPESLVVSTEHVGPENDSSPIGAIMFVREYVGPGPTWPPEPAGCITLWHGHDNLCYDKPFLEGGSVQWIADLGGCSGDDLVRITPEMLHVWVDGTHDTFEGIET
jgi:hypothetical protein